MKKIYFILILTVIALTSCLNADERFEKEERDAYLKENNITVEPTESGLYYIETLEGTGNQANPGDVVLVSYTGKLLDGTVFDSSSEYGYPFQFTLGAGEVIKGWDEGISYMKEGGKATLIIPSDLAYGKNGTTNIPPYSTLIFDIELLSIAD